MSEATVLMPASSDRELNESMRPRCAHCLQRFSQLHNATQRLGMYVVAVNTVDGKFVDSHGAHWLCGI